MLVASSKPSSVTLEPLSKFWIHVPFHLLPLPPVGDGSPPLPLIFATLVTHAGVEVGALPSAVAGGVAGVCVGDSGGGFVAGPQREAGVARQGFDGQRMGQHEAATPATATPPAGGWLAFAP